jgi:hypothetical protein
MHTRKVLLAIVTALAGTAMSISAAAATPQDAIDTVVVDGRDSDLTLEFDVPVSSAEAREIVTDLPGDESYVFAMNETTMIATSTDPAPSAEKNGIGSSASASAIQQIYCGQSYGFGDSNGYYTVQRQCGVKLAPWGYRLSASAQSICVPGTVTESGMNWTKNGATMPRNAAHANYPCGYQFHGTYNPVQAGDTITYSDKLVFRHILGTGGTATVRISGTMKFRGSGS